MNLLLVEEEYNLSGYINDNTDIVTFKTGDVQSYNDLLDLISDKNKQYTVVGIFSHGIESYFHTVTRVFNDKHEISFKTFLQELKQLISFETIDIFACYFGQSSDYIIDLETSLSINVRASTDETGNVPFGDWIMESDNTDIRNIYFNDTINDFKEILGGTSSGTMLLDNSGDLWVAGLLYQSQGTFGLAIGSDHNGQNLNYFTHHNTLWDYISNQQTFLDYSSKTITKIFSNDATYVTLMDTGEIYWFGGTYKIYAAGMNSGLPNLIDRSYFNNNDIKQVSIGSNFMLFLDVEGNVYSCNYNVSSSYNYGQTGLGDSVAYATPQQLDSSYWNNRKILKISAGNYHSLILDNTGVVYGFGHNTHGTLGQGINDTAHKNVPTPILTTYMTEPIVDIATGYYSSYFIDINGKMYSCGRNDQNGLAQGIYYQTGRAEYNATLISQTPSNANYYSIHVAWPVPENNYSGKKLIAVDAYQLTGAVLALDDEGSVYQAGGGTVTNTITTSTPWYLTKLTQLSGITEISLGENIGRARNATTGDVYLWGQGTQGALGTGGAYNSTTPLLLNRATFRYITSSGYTNGGSGGTLVTETVDVATLEDYSFYDPTVAGVISNSPPTGSVTVSGDVTVGSTLSSIVSITDANGISTGFTYQWVISDTSDGTYSNITDATDATYVIQESDYSKFIKLQVSYTDDSGNLENVNSNATDSVSPSVSYAMLSPRSNITVGDTINTTLNISPDLSSEVTYVWYRSTDGQSFNIITGETSNSYVIVEDDIGNYIRASIYLNDTLLSSETTTSIVISVASSSGDPYVRTLSGFRYKLPNVERIYRCIDLYQNNKRLIVNCKVSQLTRDEIDELTSFAKEHGNQVPVTDGYFYKEFFVKYGDKYVLFDRKINIIETNINTCDNDDDVVIKRLEDSKIFECPIQGRALANSFIIRTNMITIELIKILHPQIINGIDISFSGNDLKRVSGIFNTCVHPKYYRLRRIDSQKVINIQTNRKYTLSHNETWLDLDKNIVNKVKF